METDYIDAYCERVGPEIWAEPVNAITNLAFIIAALALTMLLARMRASAGRSLGNWLLVFLIFAIGIGSFLFHTFATVWAAMADTIPIALFILLYTYLAVTRFIGAAIWGGLLAVLGVLGLAVGLPMLTGIPGGPYIAALVTMAIIGLYLRSRRNHPAGQALLTAALIFAISLGLRTIDETVCVSFPMGTHFLWHLLNAIVLYLVTRAMIRYGGVQDQISGEK